MSELSTTLEEKLVNHIADTRIENLNEQSINCCKKLIVDALGVSFPGSKAPACPEIIDLFGTWNAEKGASLLLSNIKVPPPLAAMANSTIMHAMDFDDTLDASALHTFVNVLPAALAAAEARSNVSGKELITALVIGVDIICRISLAINRPLSWIRTSTCGGFGAAATAAKILGLNREQIANALGIVYSQTSGNAQGLIEGRLVKRMQPGFAASAGVMSALLAQKGITGSKHFLTGPYGYYNLYEQGQFDAAAVTKEIGKHQSIVDLSIKPYPACRMTHASIDAALALKDRLSSITEIERIDVSVCSMATEMVGKPFKLGANPQVDAQFSIPYTVACALARGDVFLQDFEIESISDPAVTALAQHVNVETNPGLAAKDILRSKITITCKDGATDSEVVAIPLGNPGNPMDTGQCRQKFKKCLAYSGYSMPEAVRDDLFSKIGHLESLADINELIHILVQ